MIRCRKCGCTTLKLFGRYIAESPVVDEFDEHIYLGSFTDKCKCKLVYDRIVCAKCGSSDIEDLEQLKEYLRNWFNVEVEFRE
ncbi:MAG: hypothetical protein DRJ38_00380 [Thermoprotei archaeon]|nr:MAG: hypothetical protein DRJ38_00380 [Thermoprotei archaeon]